MIRVPANINIPNYYFLKTADVIVERIGNKARAVDKYGNIIAEGTDHADVIQSAVDEIYSKYGGGKVYIESGEYDGEGKAISIASVSNISIVGAGVGKTILKSMPIVKSSSTETENVVIAHMTLDGMSDVGKLIDLPENSKNFWLAGLHLKNSNDMGLYWGGASVKVIGCIFENLGLDGYDMAAGHNPYDDDYALFAFNTFKYTLSTGGGGMITTGGTNDVVIVGNKFIDYYGIKYAPISFENDYGQITRVIVVKNIFINLGSNVRELNIGNKADGNFSGTAIFTDNILYGYAVNVKGFKRFVVAKNVFETPAGYAIQVDMTDKAYGEVDGNIIIDPSEVSNSWPNNDVIYVYDFQGTIKVTGNIIVDTRDTPKMVNGIVFAEARSLGVYEAIVKDNVILNGSGNGIETKSNVNALVSGNRTNMNIALDGKVYINSGKATFSGDGSTTQFKIAHGLVSTPNKVVVTPCSSDASGQFYVTVDDTYIYVNYASAPPSGTNNVCLYWEAEV